MRKKNMIFEDEYYEEYYYEDEPQQDYYDTVEFVEPDGDEY